MPHVKKKCTKSYVWNYVFTNVLIFYYLEFFPLFEFIIFIAILCHFAILKFSPLFPALPL